MSGARSVSELINSLKSPDTLAAVDRRNQKSFEVVRSETQRIKLGRDPVWTELLRGMGLVDSKKGFEAVRVRDAKESNWVRIRWTELLRSRGTWT